MASVTGWYGPLIDLSEASFHIGDFVQLLVFIHQSTPIKFKLSKGGDVIRTDIKVGDDTRSFFHVSVWQKKMGSVAFPGHFVLLQNMKIAKFGDVVEATTVHCSSLSSLISSCHSLVDKGVDDMICNCKIGEVAKQKLRKVVEWVRKTRSTISDTLCHDSRKMVPLSRNWKLPENKNSKNCFSLSELSYLTDSCTVTVHASIGELFFPFSWNESDECGKEKMFISRRLYQDKDFSLAADLICTGCELCGCSLKQENGAMIEKNTMPLYCSKSSSHLHVVTSIYRPFMLYVWDETEFVPFLVRNKAAEILFGNIRAERVYLSYTKQKQDPDSKSTAVAQHVRTRGEGSTASCSVGAGMESLEDRYGQEKSLDFYQIWFILLKMLLRQEQNSPLMFEITVNPSLEKENGRFEMISVSAPCLKNHLVLR